ncbi:O-acetylhomoserine aminocarboxypropyltransferase/cysteine synthase family protein [Psychrobacter sanguinis]|uniref:O-acetylhomoserine aminocarboxypropyltransferase/cysteine synthase family protein n=1 Tax=Psychrobacter sanguinis TaxID=861445 RepID=UPI00191B25CC|nr:aminotransferase class I/II-fold pyridoxal phosphate-dependent enzyme [Psychrobacter sanguinis]MCC3307090.1 aminotransferase class I/II-fold pyridoxal phosphate-dependent enzyme [Psychrobacter sanguinis]MDY3306790.1 aminotransferase class I/II-fold pyridoxal phosphate-dependent enzyme [Psychrobacter sanguinis]UEC24462.1 aminotransferase class I/II-fold pyridoxal phosphate-dependent enzyme [Psychrobacter sanguinis]
MSNTDNAVDNQRLETLAIHAGYTVEPTTKAVAVPIYHTSSYAFDDTQHGADLFDLKVAGNIYTRIMNPTNAVLEERVAALEGGIGALAVASGMAAITYAVQTICEVGDNIIAASTLYGGTYNFFAHTLPRQGIEVRFFDHKNPAAIHDLVDEKTKMVFAESIGNPLGNIIDIEALAEAAHQHGVPVVIDNTVATPALCRPFEFGADIVVHSLTKYMSGTGTSIGGAIVDSGNFNWGDYPERFPILNQPDVSYHGVNFVKDVGAAAYIARARVAPLRNTGAALSPLNAFSILQGIQTLSLRMERHVQNAQAVAEYLKGHDKVAWVKYAGLSDHPDHQLAQKYMKGTPSAILTFGVKGGREAGAKFIDALNLITRLVNIGDAKSLASHPATTTHRQLNEEELAKAGVSEDMIRLSIGIEHIEDIKADLEQALAKA